MLSFKHKNEFEIYEITYVLKTYEKIQLKLIVFLDLPNDYIKNKAYQSY